MHDIFVYIYTYKYVYICVYIYIYVCICICICVCVCVYVCMYVCMHACMHVCMYVYVYVYIYMYVYVYVCMYVYIYICVCMHSLLIALAALRLRISGSIPTYLRYGHGASCIQLPSIAPHRGHCLRHGRGPVPGCLLRSRCSGDVCDRVHASRRLGEAKRAGGHGCSSQI